MCAALETIRKTSGLSWCASMSDHQPLAFYIELERESREFAPGESVDGQVALELGQERRVQRVVVQLLGGSLTSRETLSESERLSVELEACVCSDSKSRSALQYCCVEQQVCGEDLLEANESQWTFSIALPE